MQTSQGQRTPVGRPAGRAVDGDRIRTLRRGLGLTQVELAKRAKLSERTVAAVEQGDRVSFATLRALAKSVDVDVVSLVR